MTIEERVAKGAALLDEKVPGWEEKIDLKELHMGDWKQCVIGQTFGLYHEEHFKRLGIDFWGSDDADHGFERPDGISYSELTTAWTTLILNRRKERAPSAPTVTLSPSP